MEYVSAEGIRPRYGGDESTVAGRMKTGTDLAYANEYRMVRGKWQVRFSFRSPSYCGDKWQALDKDECATVERMIHSGKIVLASGHSWPCPRKAFPHPNGCRCIA